MQTKGDVYNKVAGLAGDSYHDWITPEYFDPLFTTAYESAVQYLEGTCSPYIEQVVIVPSVTLVQDESNLVPFAVNEGNNKVYPLDGLMKPRLVDFRVSGPPSGRWCPVKEFGVLPDAPLGVAPQTFDFRIRGDFKPPVPKSMDDKVLLHPNCAHALALLTMALIGAERPNQGWIDNYGAQGRNALDEIAADLVRQQQHLTFRTGSPNRQNRGGWGFNLQSNVGWEWRAFGLYVKLT